MQLQSPQTIIRDQYNENKFISYENDFCLWHILNRNIYGFNINPVKNFIKNIKKDPVSPICGIHLLTHQALSRLFVDSNGDVKDIDLLKNTLIVIDEVHHVMADEYNKKIIHNRLGSIKREIFKNGNIGFMGISATPFRSDGLKIIPPEYQNDVKSYIYTYDRYISSLKHIKHFGYDIVNYEEKNPLVAIKQIYKEISNNKILIYIPSVNHHHSWGLKHEEVLDILNSIGKITHKDDVFIYVNVNGKEKKFIDLVDESNRKKKKEYLKSDCDDLDGIISLGMAKEGFDWKSLEDIILIGGRDSLVEVEQIGGRLTRDYKGKENINIYHIIPKPITGNGEKKSNDLLLNYYIAKEFGDQMIALSSIVPNPRKGKYIKGLGIHRVRILNEILSETDFINVRIECEVRLLDFQKNNPLALIGKQRKEFRNILKNILERDYNINQDYFIKLSTKLGINITWGMLVNQCWHMWSYSYSKLIHPSADYNQNICSPADGIANYYKSCICDKESWENFSSNLRNKIGFITSQYEKLKNKVKEKGGELISKEYVNGNFYPMEFKCHRGHSFISTFSKVMSDKWCPYCRGLKVDISNCLATTNPELLNDWDYEKNLELTPYDVVSNSYKKAWWICRKNKNHRFQSTIKNKKNRNSNGCPYCRGLKVDISNCLATINPELSKEWHPTLNGELTPYDVVSNSHKKVWWICKNNKEHIWEASISKRNNGAGCHFCSRYKVQIDNCLATINSELSEEWDYERNGKLTPYDVLPKSEKVVWWICKNNKNHHYQKMIAHRYHGAGCSLCSHKNIKLTHMKIKQWIQEYHNKYRKYPNYQSGIVEGTNETWCGIDSALKRGNRGLTSGSSLSSFIENNFNDYINIRKQSVLTEDYIKKIILIFFKKHNKYPTENSGMIEGTKDTWKKISDALNKGLRGLQKGSSLSKFIKKHFKN